MVRVHQGPPLLASVAKLADALDLGSSALWHGGSSPFTRTIDESVRTIRTSYININSIWVDFFVIWKIILLRKASVYDKHY